jgi:hypothetical protein
MASQAHSAYIAQGVIEAGLEVNASEFEGLLPSFRAAAD